VDELLDVVTRAYEYQRVRPAVVGTTSGLETVQLTLEGKLPTPPIIATLGISLVEAAEGCAVFEASPAEWQYNQLATVHGGWLSALLDSALGYAVQSVLPAGRGFTNLDLHIRFERRNRGSISITHGGTCNPRRKPNCNRRGSHRWPGWEGLRHRNHIVPRAEDGAMKGTYRKAELVFGLTRLAGLPQEGNSSQSPTWVAGGFLLPPAFPPQRSPVWLPQRM
jgi:uncharacterized protein (TIGR00369 family)